MIGTTRNRITPNRLGKRKKKAVRPSRGPLRRRARVAGALAATAVSWMSVMGTSSLAAPLGADALQVEPGRVSRPGYRGLRQLALDVGQHRVRGGVAVERQREVLG